MSSTKTISEIHIGMQVIFVEKDKEGYVSFTSDGLLDGHPDTKRIVDALRALQSDDDREHDASVRNFHQRR